MHTFLRELVDVNTTFVFKVQMKGDNLGTTRRGQAQSVDAGFSPGISKTGSRALHVVASGLDSHRAAGLLGRTGRDSSDQARPYLVPSCRMSAAECVALFSVDARVQVDGSTADFRSRSLAHKRLPPKR